MKLKRKVVVLGSTGSIGKATLDVIEAQREKFEVLGLSCNRNVKLLMKQIERVKPKYAVIYDEKRAKGLTLNEVKVLTGINGIKELLSLGPDIVVNALSGSAGLLPSLEAIRNGATLALANKESVVMAGRIILSAIKEHKARLIPVDSEHSAIYQLLKKVSREELKSIVLTASGGPFKDLKKEDLEKVKPKEALRHPVWKMGKKITIDSATLMNKALEIIEAKWLFDLEAKKLKVLIHPEGLLHGLIELIDGSYFAFLAYPDMRIPIAYALNEEERVPIVFSDLDLSSPKRISFYPPDPERFPALRLAYQVLDEGDSAQIVLNTSNEVACSAFLKGKISFTKITELIEEVLVRHPRKSVIEDIDSVLEIHGWAKREAEKILKSMG